MLDHVARAEKQQAFRRQPVPPRPARFLVIAFDVLGQIIMDDKPDIGFVDAQAKSDRRADHPHFVAQKKFLVLAALARRQPGVIRSRGHALLGQLRGQLLCAFPALAVNDAALARS